MEAIFAELKSKNEDSRLRAANELRDYVRYFMDQIVGPRLTK